jgi:hypothetical protein
MADKDNIAGPVSALVTALDAADQDAIKTQLVVVATFVLTDLHRIANALETIAAQRAK